MRPALVCEVCRRPVCPEEATLAVDPARALRRPPARWLVGHPGCLERAGAFYQVAAQDLLDPGRRRWWQEHLEGKRWWPGTTGWAQALEAVARAEVRR
ncbi:MAG: hypothetical protein QN193_01795 [Armatimonadota bacterium]|nr:hypothetical protein [Armatimonadota bacterium]MDR7443482.1 hypothetical protein [Armatimonadota bacterium]MDR7569321.1 hypothetical protein [Armatimonadota bacterium]MDR7614981.1 hypothetical protein [Armatimonadota bacterium]